MPPTRLPIRLKLMLLVLLAALPAAGVVLHSSLVAQKQALDGSLHEAERVTRDMVLRQEQMTASTRQLLTALSRQPAVRNLDAEACAPLFKNLLTVNPLYSDIVLADATGRVLATGLGRGDGVRLDDTPHFQAAMRAGDFVAGGYRKSRTTGRDILVFAHPVLGARHEIVGVLVSGIRLDVFQGITASISLPEDSTLFLADREGLRLFNRHYPDPWPELFPLGGEVTIKQRGVLRATGEDETLEVIGLDNKPRHYIVKQATLRPGEEPYFYAGVSLAEHSIRGKARLALVKNLAVLGLGAVVLAALAWWLGQRAFVVPIERLAEVAGRFAQGDFAARTNLPPMNDELSDLAQATDRIGQELARREVEREATLARLSQTQYAVDHAGDEIYWADKNARLLYVNDRACQSLGYSREELLAMGVGDVDAGFDPDGWPTLLDLLATAGPSTMEVVHRTKAGGLVPKELSVSLVGDGNKALVFGSARDIRERKRHEAVLRALVDETAPLSGQAFFEALAALMARQLDADAAFAAEYPAQPPTQARTLAFHVMGSMRPPLEYPLAGTPCADIPDGGHLFIPDGLLDRYPNEPELRTMGIRSYLGVALHDASGLRSGHLTILSRRPMGADPLRLPTMRLFALRAGAELERMRAERAVLASLREKEVLLKEIHHRVKNNLQIICSLLALQAGGVTDATALALLDESRARILTMALVHEDLYQSDTLAEVDIRRYLARLAERVSCSLISCRDIRVRQDVAPLLLTIDQAIPLGLLTNELLTNALKHAFPGEAGGEVALSLRQDGGEAVLEIRDNGVGLPEGVRIDKIETLGMQLIWALADQLHGTLRTSNDGGAVFTLRFPLSRAH